MSVFRVIVLHLTVLMVFSLASGKAADRVTIWHTETDPVTLSALAAIEARFEQENPSLDAEIVSVGWKDLYQKITVAVQSGTGPDLTQIEPFMAAYLFRAGQLQSLDDVLAEFKLEDIFAPVRDMQLLGGNRYGLATALGISYYAYRKDLLGTPLPASPRWDDLLKLLRGLATRDETQARILLPANDLHMTVLFVEMLAANGGTLFDPEGRPAFTNRRVLETLEFWKALFELVPPPLRNSSYKENFEHFARGRCLILPGFFGRGTLDIERLADEKLRSPEHFGFLPQPVGPSGQAASAVLDAEPWVILKVAPRPDLAKRFLRFFYRKDNYLQFCRSISVHLIPIFRSLARSDEFTADPLLKNWRPFYDRALEMIESGNVLPVFMAGPQDRLNPLLFRLEGSRVVSTMIRDVTLNGLSPQEAAEKAMELASSLTEVLPGTQGKPSAAGERVGAEGRGSGGWIWAGFVVLAALALLALLLRARRSR